VTENNSGHKQQFLCAISEQPLWIEKGKAFLVIVSFLWLLPFFSPAVNGKDLIVINLWSNAPNNIVAPGQTFTVSGSISNLSGAAMPIASLSLAVDIVPEWQTNYLMELSTPLITALGANMALAASGYTGQLFSVRLPPGVAPPASIVCEFGLGYGTNGALQALAPMAAINLPVLSIKKGNLNSITLAWSNANYFPTYKTNLAGAESPPVTNNIVTNGTVFSVTLPASANRGFFRLLAP
jgi:hypothetical protein